MMSVLLEQRMGMSVNVAKSFYSCEKDASLFFFFFNLELETPVK